MQHSGAANPCQSSRRDARMGEMPGVGQVVLLAAIPFFSSGPGRVRDPTIGRFLDTTNAMTRVRVLLAEDSPMIARQLRTLLATEFDVVGVADDGYSLLRLAAETGPDVVVTDISMPGIDGLDAARQLRKEHSKLGIVFITVHSDVQLVERAMRLGGCGYVLKSDAGEDLIAAVNAVVSGTSFLSASLAG